MRCLLRYYFFKARSILVPSCTIWFKVLSNFKNKIDTAVLFCNEWNRLQSRSITTSTFGDHDNIDEYGFHLQNNKQKDSIPVGCIPPAWELYALQFQLLQPDGAWGRGRSPNEQV